MALGCGFKYYSLDTVHSNYSAEKYNEPVNKAFTNGDKMTNKNSDYHIFPLGKIKLQGGETLPDAQLRIIPGVWGHFAGGGLNPVDTKWIDDQLKELLATV